MKRFIILGWLFFAAFAGLSRAEANQALDFEHDDAQYAEIPLTLPASGTIELWFKPESIYNYNTIFDNSANANDWEMWIYETGELRFRIQDFADLRYDLTELGSTNGWHHIAVTWAQQSTNNALVDYDLWVDGIQRAAVTNENWIDPGTNFFLAGGNSGNDTGDGQMDEVRIWSDVRTETEIADNMNSELTGSEDGLLAYYPMNQSDGTDLTDAASGSYDGILVNTSNACWVASDAPILDPESNCLDFEHDDAEYAEIPLTLPDTGTIELWFKPESFYNYNTVFDTSADANDWEMWIYESGEVRFRIENGDLRYDLVPLGGTNEWHHLAVTWEKHDTSLVDYDLWINGVRQTALTNAAWVDPGDVFYLAGGNSGNDTGDGMMDDVRIWSDVRTEAEIVDNMNIELTGNEDNLLAYYPMNQSDGTNLLNAVSDTFDGTLVNMTGSNCWMVSDAPVTGSGHFVDSPVHYVSTTGAAVWPYTSWADAATNIQDAVAAASSNDTVLVTNGVYDTGGRSEGYYSLLTNRVCITNAIVLLSVNGPEHTFIIGAADPSSTNGPAAIRCLWGSAANAVVSGFTLANGHTDTDFGNLNDSMGGGVAGRITLSNCIISSCSAMVGGGAALVDSSITDCLIEGNHALNMSGGAHLTTGTTADRCIIRGNSCDAACGGVSLDEETILCNSLIVENSADSYAGVMLDNESWMRNCTISGNTADSKVGGVAQLGFGGLYNSIVFGNTPSSNENLQSYGGTTNDPLFVAGTYRLQTSSPCINAGNNAYVDGLLDLAGIARVIGGTVDIGAYEYTTPAVITITPTANVGNISSLDISGTASEWVAGTLIWTNSANGGSGSLAASASWQIEDVPLAVGDNPITVSGTNSAGMFASDSITIARIIEHTGDSTVHYVSPTGANVWPYTNWTTAASSIQDAVYAAAENDTVRVADGTYLPVDEIVIERGLRVESVNGPANTVVNGQGMHRCFNLNEDKLACTLSGFTVTNGAASGWGGGIHCSDTTPVITNSIITGCSSDSYGGGVLYGTLTHCTISDNSAVESGGGVFLSTLTHCTILSNLAEQGGGMASTSADHCTISGNSANSGGGCYRAGTISHCTFSGNTAYQGGGIYLYDGTIYSCTFSSNTADWEGGGMYNGTAVNCTFTGNDALYGGGVCESTADGCTFTGNSAVRYGGASRSSTLNNCTVWNNSADGGYGGGMNGGSANSCIVWYNTAGSQSDDLHSTDVFHTCSPEVTHGIDGCITNEPCFIDVDEGNVRLQVSSPCIDAGDNGSVSGSTDLDGNARIIGGFVDMGAYEFTTPLSATISITNDVLETAGEVDRVDICGAASSGVVGQLNWTNAANGASGALPASTNWLVEGVPLVFGENLISVSATNLLGQTATDSIVILRDWQHSGDSPVHYVSPAGGNIWPYTNWVDAATNIQNAVHAASASDIVRVAAGTYTPDDEITVERPMTIESVSGPSNTVVNGRGLYRGFNLTNAVCTLSGFTVTNGYAAVDGGGICCADTSSIITNCIITGCFADDDGGGVAYGTLTHCIVRNNMCVDGGGGSYHSAADNSTLCGNSADNGGGMCWGSAVNCTLTDNKASSDGGGIYGGTLNRSTLSDNTAQNGGGMYDGTATDCTICGNSAENDGGGGVYGTLTRCTVRSNTCSDVGGGMFSCDADNCLIRGNSAAAGGGIFWGSAISCTLVENDASGSGGGSYDSVLTNCIVWCNSAEDDSDDLYDSALSHCCSPDVTHGTDGCITNEPCFIDRDGGNFRLFAASPCIDAGDNDAVFGAADLNGSERVIHATVDMGAYEYAGFMIDSDGDAQTDYEEAIADTSPTNAADFFQILEIDGSTVYFDSSSNRWYTLYSTTNLVEGAWTEVTNRMGVGGTDSISSTNDVPQGFYKLEVEVP